MPLDESGVGHGLILIVDADRVAQTIHNGGFDLRCGDPRDGTGLRLASLSENTGDVVAITRSVLACMARAHGVSPGIDQPAHQDGVRWDPQLLLVMVRGQAFLNGLEQLLVDDRVMIARMALAPVIDLATINSCPGD
ncbi:MAG: hypothetical protein K0S56_2133 [Microvirga sp.]|nr:hypothetical protein [Microvirga sp.]